MAGSTEAQGSLLLWLSGRMLKISAHPEHAFTEQIDGFNLLTKRLFSLAMGNDTREGQSAMEVSVRGQEDLLGSKA